MDINAEKISVIVLLFVGLLVSACERNNCDDRDYEFKLPISITPDQDTFKLGDTIYVDISFSKELIDKNSDEIVKLDSFNFFLKTIITKIDSVILDSCQYTCYAIIEDIGQLEPKDFGNPGYFLIPFESDNEYLLKYQLLCNSTGIFNMNISSSLHNQVKDGWYDHPVFHIGKCNIGIEELTYIINVENNNNNYHLLQYAVNPAYHPENYPLDNYLLYGGYAFVVVE